MQAEAYIAALKSYMARQRVTYSELSQWTAIPLSTLKKAMSGGHLSMKRLLQICHALDLDLSKLHELTQHCPATVTLTAAQEDYFCNNINDFRLFSRMLRGQDWQQKCRQLGFEDSNLPQALRNLEELGLIERHPQGQIKTKLKGVLQLTSGSPLQAKLEASVARELVKAYHDLPACSDRPKQLHVGSIMAHPRTLQQATAKLDEFNDWISRASMLDRLSYDQSELFESSYAACVASLDTLSPESAFEGP